MDYQVIKFVIINGVITLYDLVSVHLFKSLADFKSFNINKEKTIITFNYNNYSISLQLKYVGLKQNYDQYEMYSIN